MNPIAPRSLSDMHDDFRITKVRRDRTQGKQNSHIHPYYEVFYLINGDCTFFVGHNIYRLNRGDLVIVPQGEIHKSTYPDTGYSERFVISFREPRLEWLRQMVDRQIILDSLTAGVIAIPEKRREYLESLMEQMLTESDSPDIFSSAVIQTKLTEIVLFIIRCRQLGQDTPSDFDGPDQLIQQAVTYIYEHYAQKLTLKKTADNLHISTSYLSKRFKAVTGFGFKEYLTHIRIQNACRLLLTTNHSITDIALECGFSDSNYFGDAFRHVKGVPPSRYRKNREMV